MGYLYRRQLRNRELGRIWWVKYYVNGRAARESTGTEKETEARRFLKEREGRVASGQPILRRADRIRYEEVAQISGSITTLRAHATLRKPNTDSRTWTASSWAGGSRPSDQLR